MDTRTNLLLEPAPGTRSSGATARPARPPRLGFIGFGEVTQYLTLGLAGAGITELAIYSRSGDDPATRSGAETRASAIGGRLARDLADLYASSDIVFSSVHGNVALQTARQALPHLRPGQIFVDLNNAIPSVKRQAAVCVEAAGGRFVDVGLLELPIQRGHQALMYASGEAASELKATLEPFGMNITLIPGGVGKAAVIKAIANIYMKGLQGVCLEFAISARKAGIRLADMEPLLVKPVQGLAREKDVGFWIIRGALLAGRKKEEMAEAMKMMEELETDPVMLRAAVERLGRVAELPLQEDFDAAMPVAEYEQILHRMFSLGAEMEIDIR